MSRGATTLFADLVFATVLPEKQQQGRSKTLLTKRNELLLNRHYYFLRNFHFGYDSVLEILESEFHISIVTIPKIMSTPENYTYLHNLKKNPPSTKELEVKYPHLVWEIKTLLLIYGRKAELKKREQQAA
jgi:hypothetical protein